LSKFLNYLTAEALKEVTEPLTGIVPDFALVKILSE